MIDLDKTLAAADLAVRLLLQREMREGFLAVSVGRIDRRQLLVVEPVGQLSRVVGKREKSK